MDTVKLDAVLWRGPRAPGPLQPAPPPGGAGLPPPELAPQGLALAAKVSALPMLHSAGITDAVYGGLTNAIETILRDGPRTAGEIKERLASWREGGAGAQKKEDKKKTKKGGGRRSPRDRRRRSRPCSALRRCTSPPTAPRPSPTSPGGRASPSSPPSPPWSGWNWSRCSWTRSGGSTWRRERASTSCPRPRRSGPRLTSFPIGTPI